MAWSLLAAQIRPPLVKLKFSATSQPSVSNFLSALFPPASHSLLLIDAAACASRMNMLRCARFQLAKPSRTRENLLYPPNLCR